MTSRRHGTRVGTDVVSFEFDGRLYQAQQGDCAASALTAAGVRFLNRSIKYRRPRGLYALGPEEPNALLTVGELPSSIPNIVASQLKVTPGLRLRSQNRWPSLAFDLAAMTIGRGAAYFGAGFYYKTFMWPSWRRYEGLIRRLAGLGEAPSASRLPRAHVHHLEADLLVAGAGPAGLAAALTAARGGLKVIVCEREPVAGGELEFESATIAGRPAGQWVRDTLTELERHGARVLTDTAVVSTAQGIAIAHAQPAGMPGADTLYRIHAPLLMNAMGCVERGIAFVDNDLPGVMLCGAGDRLLGRYGTLPGRSVVLFANHDRVYSTAARLHAAGAGIAAIVDTRPVTSSATRAALRAQGIPCLAGHAVLRARGRHAVNSVDVGPVDGGPSRRIACDTVLVGGGWAPAVHQGLRMGGQAQFDAKLGAFVAGAQPEWRLACGAAAGELVLAAVIAAARSAAHSALTALGRTLAAPTPLDEVAGADDEPALVPYWRSPAPMALEKRQFVDLQNDVTVADLRQALQEGFTDIEHVKRYTTLGVGTDQGRTGGTLAAAILADMRGESLADVGVSRTRGPYQPVPMMALSGLRTGDGLRPARHTALHAAHIAAGGELELMGGWLRPRYYRENGSEPFAASLVEAARVRDRGGICDASTLGKLEIAGPDAAAFLDALYLSPPSRIPVARARYAALLREDGCVLDDGLVLRLGPQSFLATTSSSHVGAVLAHLEFWRDTSWSGRRVAITDVTEAWCILVAAGPRSRDALCEVLGPGIADGVRALTHMQFLVCEFKETPLRVARASFTGELAFEIHCRASIAADIWSRLQANGLMPFGLEALDALRVEKGYLTSSELSGQTAPADVGFERMLQASQSDIGRPLLDRAAFSDADRPLLVGVRAVASGAKFLGGAQITTTAAPNISVGYVTSAVYSPQLKEWVGLALVARRHAALATQLLARDPLRDGDTPVRVTSTAHFDPAGERIRV